ncbi:hypothetical protein [Candidatus Epulonipiscium viviparus]|nr:hypothetical protein [Candidatus Epulopiscium viviparus]
MKKTTELNFHERMNKRRPKIQMFISIMLVLSMVLGLFGSMAAFFTNF